MDDNGNGGSPTPGNRNDFFGSAPIPAAHQTDHARHTKEYADFTVPSPVRPPTTSRSPRLVLLAFAAVVVLAIGYLVL